MNKNSHLSPFSSSSVAEATIEEKEKTFEMILRQSKFKECTVLLSILKQNHLIHPSKHSHCCLLLLLLLFYMEYRFFLCEDIILKYLLNSLCLPAHNLILTQNIDKGKFMLTQKLAVKTAVNLCECSSQTLTHLVTQAR